jgi:hypothetical protein
VSAIAGSIVLAVGGRRRGREPPLAGCGRGEGRLAAVFPLRARSGAALAGAMPAVLHHFQGQPKEARRVLMSAAIGLLIWLIAFGKLQGAAAALIWFHAVSATNLAIVVGPCTAAR